MQTILTFLFISISVAFGSSNIIHFLAQVGSHSSDITKLKTEIRVAEIIDTSPVPIDCLLIEHIPQFVEQYLESIATNSSPESKRQLLYKMLETEEKVMKWPLTDGLIKIAEEKKLKIIGIDKDAKFFKDLKTLAKSQKERDRLVLDVRNHHFIERIKQLVEEGSCTNSIFVVGAAHFDKGSQTLIDINKNEILNFVSNFHYTE